MAGECGSCTACCRVFAVPEFKKPAGPWCKHCDIGAGCKVYASRPQRCGEFACLWLLARREKVGTKAHAGDDFRPDRCKVVFAPTSSGRYMSATTMPGAPDAWRKGAAAKVVSSLIAAGTPVVVGPPGATRRTFVDHHGEREIELTEPDENGAQWDVAKAR